MNHQFSRRIAVCLGLLVALFPGCFDSREGESDRRLRVVATVGMVAELARQIGGPEVQVEQLIGSGVDPHLYRATRDDVRKIFAADLVLYSGLMLEGKLADTLKRLSVARPVKQVTSGLTTDQLIQSKDSPEHYDPHVWMDIALWAECTKTVEEELAKLIPSRAEEFTQRANRYRQDLQKLHAFGKQAIQSIPMSHRVLITSHDAFSYFGRAYGLDVYAIQGVSSDSEAGLKRINRMVDLMVHLRVQAVFVESSIPRKSMEALIEGARSRGHSVKIGGELFSDAMGQPNTYRGTYVGMMDHNITMVTRALGGDVPEEGFHGNL